MDYQAILDHYYPEDNELRRLLARHSSDVAERALSIVRRHPELDADAQFVKEGAMLHDIGIFLTDAPRIHCHGTHPYICHGILGAGLLRDAGYERHARVCERHTGSGITKADIERQGLPLPPRDFLPETIEEKIICYADKFFSKSHPDRVYTVEQAAASLLKFGNNGEARFREWASMFE